MYIINSMTEITILKIEPGAEYDGILWDSWIHVKLNDNTDLTLFNPDNIPLENSLGNLVNARLSALFIEKNQSGGLYSLIGKIYKRDTKFIFKNEFVEMELNEYSSRTANSKEQEYFLGRIDLLSIHL